MKDGMSGMLQQVRLGQVRKARKSLIIQPPVLSMSIFRNSEKNRQIKGHPGGVRWWKNGLRGLFKQVRLGQVRKAKKIWKSEALGPPIHSLTCFGRIFERTVFERTTYPDFCNCFRNLVWGPTRCNGPLQVVVDVSDIYHFWKKMIYLTWKHLKKMNKKNNDCDFKLLYETVLSF